MSPMQQIFLGLGAVAKKTYIDDIFSTYLWEGNSTENRNINNGINLSGEGGMVWIKKRNASDDNLVYDTHRGHNERIIINSDTDNGGLGQRLTGFNANGFKLGNNTQVNASSNTYSSFTFRKAPGFFDVVTYTGNGTSGRAISHSLGCRPGFVIVKRTIGGVGDWKCLHRYDFDKYLELNQSQAAASSSSDFPSHPTSTTFTVSSDAAVNKNGDSYVAYLFAGDNSDSVHFDGSGDTIRSGTGNAFTHGTNDFTIECWAKFEDTADRGVYQHDGLMTQNWSNYPAVGHNGTNWVVFGAGGNAIHQGGGARTAGKWYHLAHVRNSGTTKLYVDGVEKVSFTDTYNYQNTRILIGGYYSSSYLMKGNVTNWRLVKGRALYTSNFTPPTTPLGKTYDGDGNMDTFFLCCNTGDPAGFTIDDTGNGLSVYSGDPQHSADVPSTFKASSSVFGENADQNVIKCGSYTGGTLNKEINVGFEPQWVLLKATNYGQSWRLVDMMRGFTANGLDDKFFNPNQHGAEHTDNRMFPTPTGFGLGATDYAFNGSGGKYIYIAIRRPDGYVGKPPELGTDVFAMDGTANGSNVFPQFTSNFPVDFSLTRNPTAGGTWDSWHTGARLLQGTYQLTATNNAWASGGNFQYDYNDGIFIGNWTNYMSWMWKRHAGFDVVNYTGNGTAGHQISHSMNKAPEMIWIKRRDASGNAGDWMVGHKDLNGGSSPWNEYLVLNKAQEEYSDNNPFNNFAPTTTAFQLSAWDRVNANNSTYIAMLFASVDGICKVGSYTGTGSSGNTITTGFQPRFVIIKNTSRASTSWTVLDTVRGWGSGDDKSLELNDTQAQETYNYGAPTSTGFTLDETGNWTNRSNDVYIYLAHA